MRRLCLLPVLAFASACHIAFPIDPYDGDAALGTPPQAYSSPSPTPTLWGGAPKSFSITLAADQPGATIFYTTDGTPPDVNSTTTMSSATPIRGITISANTTVQYFAMQSNGARGMTKAEDYKIDMMSATSNAGYLVTGVTLDGTSPVVIAAPGATLAAKASVQTWVQTGAGSNSAQVVYGVEDDDQGCLFDGQSGTYPGNSVASKAFNVKAPMTPGVYDVNIVHIEELSCATAIMKGAIKARRPYTLSRIGVIVVR
jgi:hypothetical protein